MKGGYVLINCGGLNLLSESAQTITGLFNTVKAAYGKNKVVVAENVKWGTTPMSPIPVFVNDLDGVLVCTASTLQIRIASNDSVTIYNMAPAADTRSASAAKSK